MTTIAGILRSKPEQTVYTTAPDVTVFEAVKLMAEKNVGALVVMEDDKIVGLVTERDYARKIVLMDRTSKATSVRDVMTSPVICVRPEQTNEECMALMTERRFRHLPVIAQGRLAGIVSIGDLVKDKISEQKFIIEQLELYISGDRG